MNPNVENILLLIAKEELGVDTRNSDCLDFHEVSVWGIKAALKAAFMSVRESGIATQAATKAKIAA